MSYPCKGNSPESNVSGLKGIFNLKLKLSVGGKGALYPSTATCNDKSCNLLASLKERDSDIILLLGMKF
jgi:hypothetical protein